MAEVSYHGLVEKILSIAPDVVKIRNKRGDFPIHIAMTYWASKEDVMLILASQGQLPLHCSCHDQMTLDISNMLLDEYPEAVKVADNAGQLPIHYVCCIADSSTSVRMLDMFLLAHPDGWDMKTNAGKCPSDHYLFLHYAAYCKCSNEVEFFLLTALQTYHKKNDKKGRIPLHYACASKEHNAVEKVMILVNSSSAKSMSVVDRMGMTPNATTVYES